MTSHFKEASHRPAPAEPGIQRIGCVSYLNAKPLIDGLAHETDSKVKFDVPSQLRTMLETHQVDMALCPIIDYHQSSVPFDIVPVGGIGCLGPTLTVRLYSRVTYESLTQIHVDADSHTSVVLLQIILWHRYGTSPQLIPLTAPRNDWDGPCKESEAVLLIGDKVITNHPHQRHFPHQLDLGEAWYELTGLPFVFAVWMARHGAPLGDLPGTLDRLRLRNASRIDQIAMRYGPLHGWPMDQAQQYLSQIMQYKIESPQLKAIEQFSQYAYDLGLIDRIETIRTKQ